MLNSSAYFGRRRHDTAMFWPRASFPNHLQRRNGPACSLAKAKMTNAQCRHNGHYLSVTAFPAGFGGTRPLRFSPRRFIRPLYIVKSPPPTLAFPPFNSPTLQLPRPPTGTFVPASYSIRPIPLLRSGTTKEKPRKWRSARSKAKLSQTTRSMTWYLIFRQDYAV